MEPKSTMKAVRVAALRPPSLRTKEEGTKRPATWLELFYDLVFVVAVARLGGRLLHDPTGSGVLEFAGLFIVIWWTWAGFTFYADRFDTDDLGQRLLAMVQIVTIALMAASVSGESESTRAFALSYIGARLVLITMYIRARYHVPETKVLITGYVRGMIVAVALWSISVFIPEPWRIIFWVVGMAVDLATPYIMRKEQAAVPLDVTHLPERFGLFTILVLGEPVASVVAGLSETHWSASVTFSAIMAIFVTAGLWWLYFHNIEGSVVRRLPKSEPTWKPTAWIYSHLPLAMGVVVTGIGLDWILTDHFHTEEQWILAGGLSLAFLSMALILYVTIAPGDPRTNSKAVARLAAVPIVLIVGAIAGELAMGLLTAFLAVIVAIEVATDLFFEPHRTSHSEH